MSTPIEKAGGLITRTTQSGERELYVVHRQRYDDWSVPKGHIDQGETPQEAALREVAEETGFVCRIVRAVEPYLYRSPAGEENRVYFFEMEVESTGALMDQEVDEGRWISLNAIDALLSYPHQNEYIHRVLR